MFQQHRTSESQQAKLHREVCVGNAPHSGQTVGAGEEIEFRPVSGLMVLVPAYRPGTRFLSVLREARALGEALVVVDDGSPDHAGALARHFADQVLTHEEQLGVGAAYRTGIRFALENGYGWILTMDSDGQHRISDAKRLKSLALSSEAELVCGNRYHPNFEGIPDSKLAAHAFALSLMRHYLGVECLDVASGLRMFPTSPMLLSITAADYGFLGEHILVTLRSGGAVKWLDIAAEYRPGRLWATRARTVLAFVEGIQKFVAAALAQELEALAESIRARSDFTCHADMGPVHGFYVSGHDAYIFQSPRELTVRALTHLYEKLYQR